MTNHTKNFIKAMESVEKFLATETHKNVVSHFNETKYTCDFKTEKGCFLQSVIINEVEEKVEMRVYWDFNVSENSKDKVVECLKRIDDSQSLPLYSVGFDSLGRIYSSSSENYEKHEIKFSSLECMESICLEAYDNFSSVVASVNAGNNIDEDFFNNIVDASYFWDSDDEAKDSEWDDPTETFIDYETFRMISLRPAVHSGETFWFALEFDNTKLYKADMNRSAALALRNGDTCYARVKAVFDKENSGFVDLYMSGEILDEIIDRFGTEKITGIIFAKLEAAYKVYSSVGDPFFNDSELIAYKLLELFEPDDE